MRSLLLLYSVLLLLLELEIDHLVNFLRTVTKQTLKVAHKPIHVALARSLQDDILVIVIPGKMREGETSDESTDMANSVLT